MLGISYWIFPLISSLVWLATLLGLLLDWIVDGRPILPSMDPPQRIAYISDTGAFRLKPLFIAGACITTIFLDLSFASERLLRHRGRLAKNLSRTERVLSGLSMVSALVGTVGLILLSIYDTYRHSMMHNIYLLMFMGGYILSAIFICWEYQRLGVHFRQHRILRISFWIKLTFILVELAIAIAFIAFNYSGSWNVAAVLEWAVAFIFTFYVASFIIDLLPAVHTKNTEARRTASGLGRDTRWDAPTEMQHEANDPTSKARTHGLSNGHLQGNAPASGHGFGRGGVGHFAHGGSAHGSEEGRRTAESQRTLGRNDVRTVNGIR